LFSQEGDNDDKDKDKGGRHGNKKGKVPPQCVVGTGDEARRDIRRDIRQDARSIHLDLLIFKS